MCSIEYKNNLFIISTNNTQLILSVIENNVYKLFYGKKISGDYSILNKITNRGEIDKKVPATIGLGDFRESQISLINGDGSFINEFDFKGYKITENNHIIEGLPYSHGDNCKTLQLEFIDYVEKIELYMYFTVYADSDVISQHSKVVNIGSREIHIKRLMSLCLDLDEVDYEFITFNGSWAAERERNSQVVSCGIVSNESKTGVSSNLHNPFVMVKKTKRVNACYGFNLVYSGNHKEILQASPYNNTRFMIGMNDFMFDWTLSPQESFSSPQGIMTYGEKEEDITSAMHKFVLNHIIDKNFIGKLRPVLVNNWEGTYFDFNEEIILALADKASEIGAELFVLDDGWFGKRDNSLSGLGDWTANFEKLPGGLERLSNKIREKGLKFGIWVEPEMISEDSDLFRAHPEYAMTIPNRTPTRMRNQLMLDVTNSEVQDYIYRSMVDVFNKSKADYVKWDFNRVFTDVYSLTFSNMGEYYHRYFLGLYKVLDKLKKDFPNILFESCAGGGNRYDLGMLCYMPQIWASDNTDARSRLNIQEGTLSGYHQSTMGAHVSICPNHQTNNSTSIESRFNVACAGNLGYELDLTKVSENEIVTIKKQIEFYKKYRKHFQFDNYCRLDSVFDSNFSGWMVVSDSKDFAIATLVIKNNRIAKDNFKFYFKNLEDKFTYKVTSRKQDNVEDDIEFIANGDTLCSFGLDFGDLFKETDRKDNSNSIASRMFIIKKI